VIVMHFRRGDPRGRPLAAPPGLTMVEPADDIDAVLTPHQFFC